MASPFEILLATPGRLEQLIQQKHVNLSDLRFLVFDEADQILDEGFLPVIKRILKSGSPDRQMALFTATAPAGIQALIEEMVVDRQGKVLNANFHDYKIPTTMDMPDMDTEIVDSYDHNNFSCRL